MSNIYQEMLAEAQSPSTASGAQDGNRATKRRRVGERSAASLGLLSESQQMPDLDLDQGGGSKSFQTVYDVDASEESDAEDWEDVELHTTTTAPAQTSQPPVGTAGEESLQITLEKPDPKGKQKAPPRRKPVTAAEKRLRLDIHKVHLLCLLSHVQLRNLWCNDEQVQVQLSLDSWSESNLVLPEIPQTCPSETHNTMSQS